MIDNVSRLYEDLEMLCYDSTHNIVAFGIALPALVLWGLGTPTFGLGLIFKNRNELNSRSVKTKYGFIYNGYRNPQAYYWEFIIMYRKIAIIFIQVFMAQLGKIV